MLFEGLWLLNQTTGNQLSAALEWAIAPPVAMCELPRPVDRVP
jgi:hypothetical protein